MGFRARKSIKIAPGVRMTVSPKSASLRVGPRGAGISANTRGQVTRSVGIPGSGIYHQTTSKLGASSAREAATTPRTSTAPSPSMFAPKWEKALHKALVKDGDIAAAVKVADQYPEAREITALFEALLSAIPNGDLDRARSLLEWVYRSGFDPAADAFISKFLPDREFALGVAEGVIVSLPLDRDALALLLAEILQTAGALDAAVDTVEGLENPTTIAAVSLAELYADQKRWDAVVELTNGISNEDEPSMYLLIQRGIALRENGFFESAREAFKEALRIRSRPGDLRNRAYLERGITYLTEGKKGMARKDFERVLAQDANYPGLREQIAQLPEQNQ